MWWDGYSRGVNYELKPHSSGLPPSRGRFGGQVGATRRSPPYVSAKRTHFISATYSMHHFYLQRLVSFALTFANGFVLEKRTHFGGVLGVFFIEKRVRPRKTKPPESRNGDVP